MSRESGFTLVELMITIALVAIIVGIAIPSFRDMIMNNRLVAQANDVVTLLNLGRSEAVKRGRRVVLCNTADPNAAPACQNGTTYSGGMLLFAKVSGNNSMTSFENNDELIKIGMPALGGIRLDSNGKGGTSVAFRGDGTIVNQTLGTPFPIRFYVCDSRGDTRGRMISVNAIGRVRSGDISSNDGPYCLPIP